MLPLLSQLCYNTFINSLIERIDNMRAYERFLRYVTLDTSSSHLTGLHPSTPNQKKLGALLVEEMKALALTDVAMDEASYVYGTIPATIAHPTTIGFVSHLDTSSDVSG